MNWGKSYQFFSNEKSNSKYLQGTFSISLDKFCKELNLKPNYIKIDVDGNEQQIIEGMKVEIKRETLIGVLIEVEKNKTFLNLNNFFNENKFYEKIERKLVKIF